MHKIELVVFDMAGTVVNENNVVYKTLHRAINQNGCFISLNFVLEHGAGKEKHQAIKDILKEKGNKQEDIAADIFKQFRGLLEKAYQKLEVTSYEGVVPLISELRKSNIKVALNTGYDRNTAMQLLTKMKWEKGVHYDALVTADDVF